MTNATNLNTNQKATRLQAFEIWFMNMDTRDFHVETIERASLTAAREYGKQREREADWLRFRGVEKVA